MSPIRCPACRNESVVSDAQRVSGDVRGIPITYLQEFSRCETCGEEFVTRNQSMGNSRAYTNAARKAQGLITPDEIVQARLALHMTQDDFEDALHVGRKTVVRWEGGTVPPSAAANGLLWFALHFPDHFLMYAKGQAPGLPDPDIKGTISTATDQASPPPVVVYSSPQTRRRIQGGVTDANAPVGAGARGGSVS
jgi:putative zinc finger/helix-turn-helix YgiT family protein